MVRGILLPAALALLGDRSWYLPRWLTWLPGSKNPSPELAPSPDQPGLPAQPAPAR